MICSTFLLAQIENVPQTNPVYTFIKEMKVKKIINYYNEDVPNLSRVEVQKILDEIEQNKGLLSNTELATLSRYLVEFSETLNKDTTQVFFDGENMFGNMTHIFSDKIKYLYAFKEKYATVYFDLLGHLNFGQMFKPIKNNAELYDIGFRWRGTVFNHLGYNLTVIKGGVSGNKSIAETIEPRLLTSFKWLENSENIGNYDFTEGYVKYRTEPVDDMNLSIQIGREPLTIGYGYGNKLVLSGINPTMDFIQFNFNYGIAHFTSIHASTVGEFFANQADRYTKFWAFNRLRLAFPNLFDIGIGESIIYSGRGIDLAYLSPLGFYKFAEMSLQDRDNGNIYFDFRSDFLKNFELQATFLLDENILSNLQDLNKFTNKTAYQLGFMWYEAFTLNDLALTIEYTKIRPYVYSHINSKNTYTSFGMPLGHPIGPNADELLARLNYNLNAYTRLSFDYRHIRKGDNVYDASGNLVKNVGGDIFLTYDPNYSSEEAYFLNGIRINYDIIKTGIRIEPFRDFIFELYYHYNLTDNISNKIKEDQSYLQFIFTMEY
jgi:Capsule assembly protein Wzi